MGVNVGRLDGHLSLHGPAQHRGLYTGLKPVRTLEEINFQKSIVIFAIHFRKIYSDLLTELRKTLKKHGDQNDSVLPLECHFLNKNAFISVVGHQPQPSKHFSLKRKPKAAALKADLMAR